MVMRFTSVKLRRFESRLLQVEVAKRADIPCGRLAEIENGRVEPQPEELRRIAAVLEMSIQHLLGWTVPTVTVGMPSSSHSARNHRIRKVA